MKYRGGYSWGGVNMGEPADETVEVADKPALGLKLPDTLRFGDSFVGDQT